MRRVRFAKGTLSERKKELEKEMLAARTLREQYISEGDFCKAQGIREIYLELKEKYLSLKKEPENKTNESIDKLKRRKKFLENELYEKRNSINSGKYGKEERKNAREDLNELERVWRKTCNQIDQLIKWKN